MPTSPASTVFPPVFTPSPGLGNQSRPAIGLEASSYTTEQIPTNNATAFDLRSVLLPDFLQHAKIDALPKTAYYIPNFISAQEEEAILAKISSTPKPRWKQLTYRRLQTWPSELVNNSLLGAPLPHWLIDPVISRLLSIPHSPATDMNLFAQSPHKAPNHVLINEYPPGVGIMPHKDGAAYHPVVCTVSLGASLCLNIHRNTADGVIEPVPAYRILQEPGSLLIIMDDLYSEYLHGIADITIDEDLSESSIVNWNQLRSPQAFANGTNQRQTRMSLTYRDVIKVSKLGNKLGMFLRC